MSPATIQLLGALPHPDAAPGRRLIRQIEYALTHQATPAPNNRGERVIFSTLCDADRAESPWFYMCMQDMMEKSGVMGLRIRTREFYR